MFKKVFADNHNNLPTTGGSPLRDDLSLENLLSGGINIFLWIIAIAAFASLIYSGFQYITAGGDAAVATKARKNILWALIGIVLALMSFVIVRAVADIPGFSD